MPMKTRQTMNTIKALGKTMIQVARVTTAQPAHKMIFLPNLSARKPPINKASNIPTQKHD